MKLEDFIKNQGALSLSWHVWIEKAKVIIAKQTEALDRIQDPIRKMQEDAKKQGGILNGDIACEIARDPFYFKNIAKVTQQEIETLLNHA